MSKTKSKEVASGELEFDKDLEFQFDDDFDFSDSSNNKKRTVVTDVLAGMKSGVKEKAKDFSFWNKIAKHALPKNYEVIVTEAENAKTIFSDSMRDAVKTLKPEMVRAGRNIDALVPAEMARLKKWTNKLKGEDDYYQNYSRNEEDVRNENILNMQRQIFGEQEAKNLHREARDRAEHRVSEKLRSKRFAATANVLGNISNAVSKLTSYTTSVNSSYQKKSLELQFRSYYVQVELLKKNVEHSKKTMAYLEAIKHNTGLPDYVKTKASEHFKQLLRQNVFTDIQRGVSAGVAKIGVKIKEKSTQLAALGSNLDMLFSLISTAQVTGQSNAELAGSQAIDILSEFLGPRLAEYLVKKLPKRPKLFEVLAAGARALSDPTNLIERFQGTEVMKKARNGDGLKAAMAGGIDNFLNMFKASNASAPIQKAVSAAKLEPHPFTNRAHKSLTEVIPGFLARMLQELSAIRTKSKKLGPLAKFDWRSNKFTDSEKIKKDIRERLNKASESGNITSSLSAASEVVTGKKIKDKTKATAVNKWLHSLSQDVRTDYTDKKIFDNKFFKAIDPKEQARIKKNWKKLNMNQTGKRSLEAAMRSVQDSRAQQLRRYSEEVQGYIDDGHSDSIESMGLAKFDRDGNPTISGRADAKREARFRRGGVSDVSVIQDRKVPPLKEDGTHPYVGKIRNYSYDHDTKKYTFTSDRNKKTNIRDSITSGILNKFAKIKTYTFNYKKSAGEGKQRVHGYMAQEMHKLFGKVVSPDGKSLNMDAITSLNTDAIKELFEKIKKLKANRDDTSSDSYDQSSDSSSSGSRSRGRRSFSRNSSEGRDSDDSLKKLLKSIDQRMADIGALLKVSSGANPRDSKSRGLFGDTVGLAGRYLSAGIGGGAKAVGIAGRAWMGTANTAASVLKGLGGFAGNTFKRNKGRLASAGQTAITDVFKMFGMAYNGLKGVATGTANTAKYIVDKTFGKVKESLSAPKDIYIPGKSDPVLLKDSFINGEYTDAKGKTIRNLDDLKRAKGPIYKSDGNVAVTKAQLLEGLVDKNGTKISAMITNFKDIGVAGLYHVGSRMVKGMGKMLGVLGTSMKMGGKVGAGIGKAIGAIGGKLLPGGRQVSLLTDILKLMKKWDKKGIKGVGGGGGSSNWNGRGSSSPGPSGSGPSGPVAGDLPTGTPADTFTGLGNVSSAFSAASSIMDNPLTKKIGSVFSGTKLGGYLGKTKLGKRAGKLYGLLGSGIGKGASLFGKASKLGMMVSAHSAYNMPMPTASFSKPGDYASSMAGVSNRVSASDRAWNDQHGTGRRTGDWRTELEKDAMGVPGAPSGGSGTEGLSAASVQAIMNNVTQRLEAAIGATNERLDQIVETSETIAENTEDSGDGGILGDSGDGGGRGRRGSRTGSRMRKMRMAMNRSRIGRTALKVGRVGMRVGRAGLTAARFLPFLASPAVGMTATAAVAAIPAILGTAASIAASPIVIAGAAIIGTAYAYKYFTRNNISDLERVRFMQYGFGSESLKNFNSKLGNLEGYLLDGRLLYELVDGKPKVKIKTDKLVDKDVMEAFGVDPESKENRSLFFSWFQKRFLPFFITAATALLGINPKAKLNNLGNMTNEQKGEFLKAIKFENGPYDYVYSPVKELNAINSNKVETINYIDKLISIAMPKKGKDAPPVTKAELDRARKEAEKDIGGAKKEAESSTKSLWNNFLSNRKDVKTEEFYGKAGDFKAFVDEFENKPKPGSANSAVKAPAGVKAPPLAPGALADSSAGMARLKPADKGVNINGLHPAMLKNLAGMAEEYFRLTGKNIVVNSAYRTAAQQKATGGGQGSLHRFGLAADIDTVVLNECEKLGLMKKYGFTRPVGQEGWHLESAGIQGKLNEARANPSRAGQLIEASLFRGGGGTGITKGYAKFQRDTNLQAALMGLGTTPTVTAAEKTSNKVTAISTPGVAASTPSIAEQFPGLTPPTPKGSGSAVKVSNPTTTMSGNKSASLTTNGSIGLDASGETPKVNGFKPGPAAKAGSAGDKELLNEIAKYSRQAGMDPTMLQAKAIMESTLNPNAQNKTTSAGGMFQFLDATWAECMRKYGKKYGLKGDEPKSDVRAATLLACEYLKSNLRAISSSGRKITPVEAYLTHMLGGEGARQFLEADPNELACNVRPTQAASNPETFYHPDKKPRTVSEMYDFIQDKIATKTKQFGVNLNMGGMKGSASGATASSSASTNTSTAVSSSPAASRRVDRAASSGPGSLMGPPEQRPVMNTTMPNPVQSAPRTAGPRVESADSPMKELLSVGTQSVDIQKQTLNVMIEMKDIMKAFASSFKSAKPEPATPAPEARRTEPMSPALDMSRRRA